MMTDPAQRFRVALPRSVPWSLVAAMVVTALCGRSIAFDERIDNIMYHDPEFPEFVSRAEFSSDLMPLWVQALARPESELQRMAADTIAIAHRSGMDGLGETADKLIAILGQDQLEPSVRRAVASSLIALDARQAAKALAETLDGGSLELARLIEPALARWEYEPIQETWRKRLADPETERLRLQLAVRCLGIAKDTSAFPALDEIVKDTNAEVPLRLAAARAAAEINRSDVITAANELASNEGDQPTASFFAVALLALQSDSKAISLLARLANHESQVVSGLALRRLFEIDPANVYALVDSALRSTDVNARRVGCEALVHKADAESIERLSSSLDDTNPRLRRYVSNSLIRLAMQPSLREKVIQTTSDVVSRDAWRGLEQGVIILVMLDHKPSASRLLELLTHRRPEVAVAASWGLRKLAVPETIPAMFAHAESQTELVVDTTYDGRYLGVIDAQLSQLFQAFGELGYKSAESLMRQFIPKTLLYSGDARPAAVWAIGKLNEGVLDEPLASQLAARLADVLSMMPEVEQVRRMSAIAIGRMNAESQIKVLREFVIEAPSPAGLACAWSLERMTGETREYSFEHVIYAGGWFLAPYGIRPTETD
ncbi:MAG: hypothetical protein H8E66_07045 [Planctomycetes bacterium]|nr:hypothetical protein [Planctomycetota bacterium]